MTIDLGGLADSLAAGRGVGVDRATALALSDPERTPWAALLAGAERIRQERRGDRVRRCMIVNARSGACSEDCAFCAQSRHHTTATTVFPLLSREEILARARDALAAGVTCFGIVTSGRKPSPSELDELAAAARGCRELGLPGIGLSVGILDRDELARLRKAGVDHINHNLETSRRFYPEICTTHSWDERRATVAAALALGLRVCCGGIFGLGETWADRVDLALALRELGVDQVPLNFLAPVPGTPLGTRARLPSAEALRVIAVYRFLLPDAVLGICGGRPETLGERQGEVFAAGADGLMTGDYLTTTGIDVASDLAMIRAAGLHSEVDRTQDRP